MPTHSSTNARVLHTFSRVEVDPTLLPNKEKTTQSLVATQLLAPPVNVFVPSSEQVADDRIQRIIEANPLSTVLKPYVSSVADSVTEKARRGAAQRTGKMLDFCNRFRLGDQTRKSIPGSISITDTEHHGKKNKPHSTKTASTKHKPPQTVASPKKSNKRKSVKLSKSQLMGRQRLSMERGELFLSKSVGELAASPHTSKRPEFSMAKIQEWFDDIPEEFRLCKLPTTPTITAAAAAATTATASSTSSSIAQLKPLSAQQQRKGASMSELIRQDESKYQNKYKQKKAEQKGKRKNKGSKSSQHRHKNKKKKTSISKNLPSTYFRVNKEGSPGRANQTFDAVSKIVVGFDTFERGSIPKRIPPRLAQFWAQHEASGVGPKILSDGYTLSEFDISIKKLGQLEVSTEMQAAMKHKVLQPGGAGGDTKTMTDIWNDFWIDEVGSELAAPLDSAIFVNSSGLDAATATREAPTFVVDDASATANVPHGARRFAFANHAHVAASRIQKIYHKRRIVRHHCSTRISSVFHGFRVRKTMHDKRREMHHSALLIASVFRGMKARQYVEFVRSTGWNHIAILCQRCMRRWLAKKEVGRRRFARTYDAATNIQRVWHGIWGRQKFKQWKMYVRDRSAKSIQNMLRWYNFRNAKEDYAFTLLVATEDIQRVYRGHLSRTRVQHLWKRVRAAEDIQRVWYGYLGRRRFQRKMSTIRAACITIQIRVRGILARSRAGEIRRDILVLERDRTAKEEDALTRRLEETRDYMVTKAGKIEHKLNRTKIATAKRGLKIKELLLSQRKSKLLALKKAFELIDYRSTGLIDRVQFQDMLLNVLHLTMSAGQLETAWSKTGTVVAKRGGYRLSDLMDRRELEEIVAWYESNSDRTNGWKNAVHKMSKKSTKTFSCKPGVVSRMGMKQIFARTRLERVFVFRKDRPPPFSCPTCTKRFVFSYEVERHMQKGKVPGCPSKYYCPVLDD